MPLRVQCQCGESLTVPEDKAGMEVLCPVCSEHVTIPSKRKVVPPPPPKSTPVVESKPDIAKPKPKPKPTSDTAKSNVPRPAPRPREQRHPPTPPAPPGPPPLKKRVKDLQPSPPPLTKQDDSGEARTTPVPSKPPIPPPPPKSSPSIATQQPIAPPATTAAWHDIAPPPAPEAEETLRGVEHDPGKIWTVYQFGMCVAILALVGMLPAILEVARHYQDFDSRGVESWAFFLFMFSGLQMAYALYMVQLPDWSSTWVVVGISAMVSVVYAMGMGIALMSREENTIIDSLGLSNQQAAGYVGPWCLLMTLLMSLLTYFLIRASLKWQKAYDLATAGR